MDSAIDGVDVQFASLKENLLEGKRIAGVEQDDITKPSPRAEIPKSQDVIISYDVSQIRGRRPALPWPVPCNSTTLEPPPLHRQNPPGSPKQDFPAAASSKQVLLANFTTPKVSIQRQRILRRGHHNLLRRYYLTHSTGHQQNAACLFSPPPWG